MQITGSTSTVICGGLGAAVVVSAMVNLLTPIVVPAITSQNSGSTNSIRMTRVLGAVFIAAAVGAALGASVEKVAGYVYGRLSGS